MPRWPLAPEAIRTLRYMQDIESHTVISLDELTTLTSYRRLMALARLVDAKTPGFRDVPLVEPGRHARRRPSDRVLAGAAGLA